MEKIKPIFKDLCKTDPLEKCHKDETLNPNESLNNIIWSVIPKRVFVMLPTLRYGSFSDFFSQSMIVSLFKSKSLEQLGLSSG